MSVALVLRLSLLVVGGAVIGSSGCKSASAPTEDSGPPTTDSGTADDDAGGDDDTEVDTTILLPDVSTGCIDNADCEHLATCCFEGYCYQGTCQPLSSSRLTLLPLVIVNVEPGKSLNTRGTEVKPLMAGPPAWAELTSNMQAANSAINVTLTFIRSPPSLRELG